MLKNRQLSDLQFFGCSNVPPFCKELIFSSFEIFCKILTEIKFLILSKLLLAEKVLWQPFCLNIKEKKCGKQASGMITMAVYSFCANMFSQTKNFQQICDVQLCIFTATKKQRCWMTHVVWRSNLAWELLAEKINDCLQQFPYQNTWLPVTSLS